MMAPLLILEEEQKGDQSHCRPISQASIVCKVLGKMLKVGAVKDLEGNGK